MRHVPPVPYQSVSAEPLKLAVTLAGALRLTFCGVDVPVSAPENPEN